MRPAAASSNTSAAPARPSPGRASSSTRVAGPEWGARGRRLYRLGFARLGFDKGVRMSTEGKLGFDDGAGIRPAGIRRRKVSRVAAIRAGLEALGFVPDKWSTCSRRDRLVSRQDTPSREYCTATQGVYVGAGGAVRLGRTLASSYSVVDGRLGRAALAAAAELGLDVRAPRPSVERQAPAPIDWPARAGFETTGAGVADLAAREIARQVVTYAVGRAISCHGCGAILDARRAWLVGDRLVICDTCHEHASDASIGRRLELAGGGAL